ncbi:MULTISPECIES: helix-turn-helix transcriptional regulator [unclassified Embleya]|uniref:helix-turn-helix domain-containing protein n=1 Tax=unclassified Embleya TaxID=2699296 RepID=UPI00340B6550
MASTRGSVTGGSVVGQRTLGAMLKAERKRVRGRSLKWVVEKTQSAFSVSRLSRLENGDAKPTRDDVKLLLKLYGVPKDQQGRFYELLPAEGALPKPHLWYEAYGSILSADLYQRIAIEHEAVRSQEYLPLGIPGLLQTRDYAALTQHGAYLAMGADERADHTRVRMLRQERLDGSEPLVLTAYITEATLLLTAGAGPELMAAQMQRLIDEVDRSNITIRVVPNSAGLKAMYPCGINLLEFGDASSSVVYLDVVGGSVLRDNERDIQRTLRVFEELDRQALPQEKTLELLHRKLREIS